MRRFARSRGRKGSARRKTDWAGLALQVQNADLTAAGTQGYNAADVITAWAVWPGGQVAFLNNQAAQDDVPYINPVDQTLVRTIGSGQVQIGLQNLVQSPLAMTAYVGLIAWDSQDPTHEHGNVLQWPEVPHPADPSPDWIVRIPVCFTIDNFVVNWAVQPWTDSRAMRKLPDSTGVLCVFGVADFIDDGATVQNLQMTLDFRCLVKSGMPSPG